MLTVQDLRKWSQSSQSKACTTNLYRYSLPPGIAGEPAGSIDWGCILRGEFYIASYSISRFSPVHCRYPAGSVVLLQLNLNPTATMATLVNEELASSSRDVYWLTPPGGNLTSQWAWTAKLCLSPFSFIFPQPWLYIIIVDSLETHKLMSTLSCSEVTLNGKLLQLVGDSLPALEPQEQQASNTLTLPALSLGFHVFKDTVAPACT